MKIAAGAVLGAVLVAVSGAAVGQDKANGPPFWVGQHSWPSKQAFMDSGARCGTRPLSDIERATVEEKIGPLVAARAELLREELNIHKLEDLLSYYPFRYVDRGRFYRIAEVSTDMPYIQIQVGRTLAPQRQPLEQVLGQRGLARV